VPQVLATRRCQPTTLDGGIVAANQTVHPAAAGPEFGGSEQHTGTPVGTWNQPTSPVPGGSHQPTVASAADTSKVSANETELAKTRRRPWKNTSRRCKQRAEAKLCPAQVRSKGKATKDATSSAVQECIPKQIDPITRPTFTNDGSNLFRRRNV